MNFHWRRRIDFLTLVIWLATSLGLAAIALHWFGMDFRGYYAAARVLMLGGNPYDYRQVAPVLLEVTGTMGNNPYYYPPWFAWLFLPVAWIPFQWARVVWMAFNVVIWSISLWKFSEGINWPAKGWRRYLLFTLLTFAFAWVTWEYEQAAVLFFSLLVMTILLIRQQRWNWVGLGLALLFIKPNLSLLVVAALCLWLIRQRQWRPVLIMLGTLLTLLLVSTLITPNWFQPFFEPGFGKGLTVVLDGPNQIVGKRINTTLLDWLAIFGIANTARYVIYGLLAGLGLVFLGLVVWRSKSILQVTAIALLVTYTLTPYALLYDYPPLAITLIWALSTADKSPITQRIALLLTAFILSVDLWQKNIAWGYWMVIGLVVLTIWVMFRSRNNPDVLAN